MRKIHIALLGKAVLPLSYLIKDEDFQDIHLLGTNENADIASKFIEEMKKENRTCELHCVEPYDLNKLISTCRAIHDRYSNDDKFTYNITGGTKIMAFCAQLVANETESKLVYISPRKEMFELFSGEKRILDIKIETEKILNLHGQIVKSKNQNEINGDELACASSIYDFMKSFYSLYSKLTKYYDRKSKKIDNEVQKESFVYKQEKKRITIQEKNKILLDLAYEKSKNMLFEGVWWETVVANQINLWSNKKYEIWKNVKFSYNPGSSKNDKNEIDILINIGEVLVFIECKSGTVTQHDINKLSAVRQTYGGEQSKAVLVSYNSINDDVLIRMKELNIEKIAPEKNNGQLNSLELIAHNMNHIIKNLNL